MTLIYGIRHGQARFGSSDYDRLSALGIEQSERLGKYFAETGVRFDAVYAGSHRRQLETAAAVTGQMPGAPEIISMTAFDEFNSGAILALIEDADRASAKPVHAATEAFQSPAAFRNAMEAAIAVAIENPERLAPEHRLNRFVDRVASGITRIASEAPEAGTIAVFTSGGTLSVFMQIALGISLTETVRLPWQILNTAASVFIHDGNRLDLRAFNTTAHLDRGGGQHLYTLL
ncbi:MAG: histidine phosphatase family protein [Pseudomonadota bacterium]